MEYSLIGRGNALNTIMEVLHALLLHFQSFRQSLLQKVTDRDSCVSTPLHIYKVSFEMDMMAIILSLEYDSLIHFLCYFHVLYR